MPEHVISIWPDSCGDLTPECSVIGCNPGLPDFSGADGGVTAAMLQSAQDSHTRAISWEVTQGTEAGAG